MTRHVPRIVIYGICDPSTGECHYVGQTRNVGQRRNQHTRNGRFIGMELVPLAVAHGESESAQKETLWYDRLKSDGEPLKNKRRPSGYSAPMELLWRCVETGECFTGYSDIGNKFGSTGGCVSSYHRDQSKKTSRTFYYDKYTFEWIGEADYDKIAEMYAEWYKNRD